MSDLWTLGDVLELRAEISSRAPTVTPERDEGYHDGAALVTSFTIDPGIHLGEAGANLATDSMLVNVEGQKRWSLKNQVRKRVLQRLKTTDALRKALESMPERPDEPMQHMIEGWLNGNSKPLDQQTPEELSATLQIVEWFSSTDLKSVLPSADEVLARVKYAAFLQPLRSLVGTHFRGRRLELAALGTYASTAGDVANLGERPPLLIFGPGGMGKSTLIAKFALENLTELPIIWLDGDRPGLVAEEPITLLAEAVYQLGLQFPAFSSTAEKLRNRWLQAMARAHGATVEGQRATTRDRGRMMQDFQFFVNDLGLRDRNVLLIIDTFEEIYNRSRAFVQELFQFLNELQALLPRLRTVLAGRHPIPEFRWEPLELGELDQEAAQAYLEALGVTSAALGQRLASLLHGNPLSLRLAAEIVRRGEVGGLEELEGLTDNTEIQGVLYRRILDHVHEQVRRIAHPGLILRRITADIIRKVLAEPCGLQVPTDARANELFCLLQSELSLVIPEGTAVRHRPDVRRVMLRPLKKDQPDKVRSIEEAAVSYYEPEDDLVSRAEEIYHRLSLGQTPEQIEPRWLPGIEDSLRSAVDELEGPARASLASRLGIELYDQDWDSVDQSTWDAYASTRAAALLLLDRPQEALRIMRRRSSRLPHSPLYWLEAQALRRSGQTLEAREVARQAICQLLDDQEWGRCTEPGDREGSEPISIAGQVMEWFAGPQLTTSPSAPDVRIQIEYLEFLRPFRTLAGRVFVGRERELQTLGSYVSRVGQVLNLRERPPLLIHGVGGVGKSTLVARFALDNLSQIPLVYVDCAVMNLSASGSRNPLTTLLAVAVRQLGLQFPACYGRALWLIDRWLGAKQLVSSLPTAVEDFRAFIRGMTSADQTMLLVFDSFEEVQFHSGMYVGEIYSFLEQLQAWLPQMRTVVVSRVPMPERRFEILEMGELDEEAAESFLAGRGIKPAELRQGIVRLVRGNPYTLQLTADLIQREGPSGIGGLEAATSISAEYFLRRVLNHIHDPGLRRIVEPAFLLRQITPDLIRHVLADPCGLPVNSDAVALEMFYSLRAELTLFTWDGEALRPRPDVRRIILGPLRRDQPAAARAIDDAAVRYYETRVDRTSRAEEVYHRLALGQPPREIEARWLPGIEKLLRGSVDELEGPPRFYLASRLGVDLSDVDWGTTDQITWEGYAARRARELIDFSRPREAIELLRKRSTRLPRSPLYSIEAEALLAAEQPREALVAAREGLRLWPDDPTLPPIIRRSEAALGADEAVAPAPPTSGVGLEIQVPFFRLRDYDPGQLTAALRDALPNSTDILNALRSMQVDPTELATRSVEEIIQWASRGDRLDELISAAVAYNPKAGTLREFLTRSATRIEYRASAPLEAILLDGGRPFFNRQVLRDFLRGLFSRSPRDRVLVVNGPRGTGKSYSFALVDFVARATGHLDVARIELDPITTLEELVCKIHELFGWRWEDLLEGREALTSARIIKRYSSVIRAKAQDSKAVKLLLLDSSGGPFKPDVLDLVRELAVDPGLRLALILAGFEPELPPAALPGVRRERLHDLSLHEIVDGIQGIVRDANVSIAGDSLHQIAEAILERAEPGPTRNTGIYHAIVDVVRELMEASP